jgi:hypothetical protein
LQETTQSRSSAWRRFAKVGLLALLLAAASSFAKQNWTEFNVGPFFVDTEGDAGSAREVLTDLEQLRWMLGGLLENRDLSPLWRVHVLVTSSIPADGHFHQVRDIYVIVLAPGARPPLDEFTKLLMRDTLPRLPDEVEHALPALFSTMSAKGSRVTWGGAPAHPDLDWARLQLFATGFEYQGRFRVFLTNLRNGSSLAIAARNAFDKSIGELDQLARDRLNAGQATAVTIGGRALDPKRDFGEHTLEPLLAAAYVADAEIEANPDAARRNYTELAREGGTLGAIGHEGLAELARREQKDDHNELEDAIELGSRSAAVFLDSAEGQSDEVEMELLKKAARLNPRWAEPLIRQAEIEPALTERENLYEAATKLGPRSVEAWVGLAETQAANAHYVAAHGSFLRAEGAADTEAERARIQKRQTEVEEGRLDAAEKERRAQRAAEEADQARVRDAQMARIHEAEKKANAGLDASSDAPAAHPVPWWDEPAANTVKGDLLRVECVGAQTKLRIRTTGGETTTLVIRDATKVTIEGANNTLTCGPQEPVRPVTVSFAPHVDGRIKSDGDVVKVHFN